MVTNAVLFRFSQGSLYGKSLIFYSTIDIDQHIALLLKI